MSTPYQEWSPCEVHGHRFELDEDSGVQHCRDCPATVEPELSDDAMTVTFSAVGR